MKENSRHGQDECPADAASVRTATKLKAKGLLQRRRSAPCGISIDVHLLRDAIRPSRYSLFNQLPLFPPEDLLGLASQIQASTQHACTKGGARLCSGPGVSESDARPRTLESFHYDVHLITGPRIQRRSIVIRGNSLFIAKSKLDSASRVKACVRLQEAWVSSCVDEVCELSVPSDQAFVLGWPISNHVLLFSTIDKEKAKEEPKCIPLKVEARDIGAVVYAKTLTVSNTTTAQEVTRTALHCFGMSDIHADSYQLLVRSGREDGVFPLIGHENPYSIKMNHLREAVERLGEDTNVGRETFPIDGHFPVESLPDNLQCHFLLKHRSNDDCSSKQLKRKRALMKWRFRRSPTKLEELVPPVVSPSTPGALFGVSLPILCPDDNPPLPIMSMLHILHREGPHTNGLFRKSANVRACRNLRERLLAGMEISWSEEQLHVIATVFKDFLRNIPGSLLCLELYEQWLILGTLQDPEEAEEHAKWLLRKLPRPNLNLLRYLTCVLTAVARHSEHNQMSASNLALCITPSLLPPDATTDGDNIKQQAAAIQFLIEHCHTTLGKDVESLLGPESETASDGDSSDIGLSSLTKRCSFYETLKMWAPDKRNSSPLLSECLQALQSNLGSSADSELLCRVFQLMSLGDKASPEELKSKETKDSGVQAESCQPGPETCKCCEGGVHKTSQHPEEDDSEHALQESNLRQLKLLHLVSTLGQGEENDQSYLHQHSEAIDSELTKEDLAILATAKQWMGSLDFSVGTSTSSLSSNDSFLTEISELSCSGVSHAGPNSKVYKSGKWFNRSLDSATKFHEGFSCPVSPVSRPQRSLSAVEPCTAGHVDSEERVYTFDPSSIFYSRSSSLSLSSVNQNPFCSQGKGTASSESTKTWHSPSSEAPSTPTSPLPCSGTSCSEESSKAPCWLKLGSYSLKKNRNGKSGKNVSNKDRQKITSMENCTPARQSLELDGCKTLQRDSRKKKAALKNDNTRIPSSLFYHQDLMTSLPNEPVVLYGARHIGSPSLCRQNGTDKQKSIGSISAQDNIIDSSGISSSTKSNTCVSMVPDDIGNK